MIEPVFGGLKTRGRKYEEKRHRNEVNTWRFDLFSFQDYAKRGSNPIPVGCVLPTAENFHSIPLNHSKTFTFLVLDT